MREELFFNKDLRLDFDWNHELQLRLGSVRPQNKKQISDGLREMSPESIRYRFLASKREFTDQELQYLTTLDGWNHYAIGVEERNAAKKGVAVVRMVRSSLDPVEAEVAITIIDEYQNKGLGLFLLQLMVLAASEREISRFSFSYLPQNEAIIKLISKLGPVRSGPHTKDYVQVYQDLATINLRDVKSRLLPILPSIETFHLGT